MKKENQMVKVVNHNNNSVRFSPENHIYILNNVITLASVTSIIKSWFPEFDTVSVAAKCAGQGKYLNMSKEEIIDAWEKNKNEAADVGTAVHAYIETWLYGKAKEFYTAYPTPNEKRDKFLDVLGTFLPQLKKDYDFIEAEKIVFSPRYRLSGTIDALFRNKNTGKILIADWKTNKEIKKSNFFEKALGSLDFLDSCNYSQYSLQLSLYQEILEQENYFPLNTRFEKKLFHITEKEVKEYPIEEFRKPIEIVLDARMACVILEEIEEKGGF